MVKRPLCRTHYSTEHLRSFRTPLCELYTISQAEKDIITRVNNHARHNYDDLNVVPHLKAQDSPPALRLQGFDDTVD